MCDLMNRHCFGVTLILIAVKFIL
ncbi:hypothetical protein B4U79_06570 [Dinothrombium tinctorium]|uniref:Uncharacterized protein n=1 Tax=Dinothrombium tinctorium TaxID=1965070 RepID=A0A443RJE6_9ACAR|nr:hypothetical protein B4U79_06570 [Dinothrombium tinctorium]